MRLVTVLIAIVLVSLISVLFLLAASSQADGGISSFLGANYLGFGAVIVGIIATVFIFRNRVHPPQ